MAMTGITQPVLASVSALRLPPAAAAVVVVMSTVIDQVGGSDVDLGVVAESDGGDPVDVVVEADVGRAAVGDWDGRRLGPVDGDNEVPGLAVGDIAGSVADVGADVGRSVGAGEGSPDDTDGAAVAESWGWSVVGAEEGAAVVGVREVGAEEAEAGIDVVGAGVLGAEVVGASVVGETTGAEVTGGVAVGAGEGRGVGVEVGGIGAVARA